MHFKFSLILALVVVLNASSTIGAPIGSLRRDTLQVARFRSAETANLQNDASHLQESNGAHRRRQKGSSLWGRQSSDTTSIPVTDNPGTRETTPVTTGEGEGDSSAPTATSGDAPVPTDRAPEGSTTPPDGTTDSLPTGAGESAPGTSSLTTPTEGLPDDQAPGSATQTESPSTQITSPVVPVDAPPTSDSLPSSPPSPASGAGSQRPPFPFGPGSQGAPGGPSRPKSHPNGPPANFRGPWAFRRPQMGVSGHPRSV